MSDFAASWELSRKRFLDAVLDLNQAQLNWRMHPNSLTIGEMAMHVAGVEVYFVSQLLDLQLDEMSQKIAKSATEGVVNDQPFPFADVEISPDSVQHALSLAEGMVRPIILDPAESVRRKQITSALGPIIDGTGALARLAFHPGYHQGQAHLIRTAPDFPG